MMNVNSIVKGSRVNGPGKRNLLYVQGCSIQCDGCFNKHLWDPGGRELDAWALANMLLEDGPDGITILGGEPLDQEPELLRLLGLLNLLTALRPSIILYTGYTADQLEVKFPGFLLTIAAHEMVDVLIPGPFVKSRAFEKMTCLPGSSNQQIILLTERHSMEELMRPALFEYILDGEIVTMTGLPPGTYVEMHNTKFGGSSVSHSKM